MDVNEKNMTLKEGMNGDMAYGHGTYSWSILGHMIHREFSISTTAGDTHILTVKISATTTTRGKQIAKRVMYDIFDAPRVVKMSGHYRLGAVYVLVTLHATPN